MRNVFRLTVALLLLPVLATVAIAAQHTLPTRVFLVRNVAPGADRARRRIAFTARELMRSTIGIVGDPTVNGSTLRVQLADGPEQCFYFPASGWFPTGSVGFRYSSSGTPGVAGIVVMKKESLSGDFLLKFKFTGAGDPINLVPVPAAPDFNLNFTVNGGDEYCAGGATPSGSIDTDRAYKARGVLAPAACGVPSCPPASAFGS